MSIPSDEPFWFETSTPLATLGLAAGSWRSHGAVQGRWRRVEEAVIRSTENKRARTPNDTKDTTHHPNPFNWKARARPDNARAMTQPCLKEARAMGNHLEDLPSLSERLKALL